ncbi:MAG: hypothetical protein WC997_04565 [Porticoccaceae bacterium]
MTAPTIPTPAPAGNTRSRNLNTYLLIALVVALVVSPLFWLKSSPGQARAAAFRQRASRLGLRVRLVPAPDAAEDDKRPSATLYLWPLPPQDTERLAAALGQWTLLRGTRNGRLSPWPEWRWFRSDAPGAVLPHLETLLPALPANVYALKADHAGVGAYLRESGDISALDVLARALEDFEQSLGNAL